MYVKIRKVTYALQTTPFQYRYLKHEIKKTERMYQYFCRQIDNAKDKQYVLAHLYDDMKHYQRNFMKYMYDDEVNRMYQYVCAHANQKSHRFYCEQVCMQYRWRNISLYKMISAKYYWQKEPLIYQWKLHHSMILYRKHRLFLIVEFIEEGF